MRYRRKNTIWRSLSFAAAGVLLFGSSALAVPPAKNPAPPTLTDLAVLENRFFSHPYAQDPVEKRIERLECMVFGGVQSGTNEERLFKLLKLVAERSQKPLKEEKSVAEAAKPAPVTNTPGSNGAGSSNSSAQYPVLNTLEWRALKKTFPSESLDQRLDRLESKMFGQPAQSMAYMDRVERLRKTLGIGIDTGLDSPVARGIGPAPRARAREDGGNDIGLGQTPFGGMTIPGMPGGNGLGFSFGFPGQGGSIFDATFDKQVHQMMEQMNKQMAEARRLGNGKWRLDPKTNSWVDIETGRIAPNQGGESLRVAPGEKGSPSAPSTAPPRRLSQPNVVDDVPAYADPNSI